MLVVSKSKMFEKLLFVFMGILPFCYFQNIAVLNNVAQVICVYFWQNVHTLPFIFIVLQDNVVWIIFFYVKSFDRHYQIKPIITIMPVQYHWLMLQRWKKKLFTYRIKLLSSLGDKQSLRYQVENKVLFQNNVFW